VNYRGIAFNWAQFLAEFLVGYYWLL